MNQTAKSNETLRNVICDFEKSPVGLDTPQASIGNAPWATVSIVLDTFR